jgi:hypothetical protein
MQMDNSDKQPTKANSERCDSFEPDSKVIVERLLQPSKHFDQILRADEGTETDNNEEHPANTLY